MNTATKIYIYIFDGYCTLENQEVCEGGTVTKGDTVAGWWITNYKIASPLLLSK